MTNGDEVDPLDAFMSTLEAEIHRGAATVPDSKGKGMMNAGSPSRSIIQQQQPLPLLEDEEDVGTDGEEEEQSKEAGAIEGAFDPEKLKNLSAEEVIA